MTPVSQDNGRKGRGSGFSARDYLESGHDHDRLPRCIFARGTIPSLSALLGKCAETKRNVSLTSVADQLVDRRQADALFGVVDVGTTRSEGTRRQVSNAYQNLSTMSNLEEMDSYVSDTQEAYKNANEDPNKKNFNEDASWNESQDFHLVVEGDESMTERTKLSMEDANRQDSAEQLNLQQIPDTSQIDDKIMATNDEEIQNVRDGEKIENESVGNVLSDINDSERKDELSDEDEIIQATPPQNHSPPKKGAGNIDITSLKRKAESMDELPAKVARTASMENVADAEKRLEEEEVGHQSDGSDDSCQDLFKNVDKNVVIEETQESTNQEFIQNSLASPLESTTDNKTQNPCHSEQINQQEQVFSEKCCSMEKNENLNVSAKLADVSNNDSIIVNVNSMHESDSQIEDNDLSSKVKRNADSTVTVEKSTTETLDEMNKSVNVKETETISNESNKIEHTNCIKKTADDDKETPRIKLRTSVELIYESTSQIADNDENKSKEVVEIDEDEGDKIVDSSTEVIYDRKNTKPEPEVVEIIDDSREDNERIRSELAPDSGEGSEVQVMEKNSFENKSSVDFNYKSTESMKESSLDSRPLTTDNKVMNGSLESKKADNDVTLSAESDTFSVYDAPIFTKADSNLDNIKKSDNVKSNSFVFRDPDNIELINISDNINISDTSNVEEKSKSDLIHNGTSTKTVQMEREIGMYVKLKCVLHMDENTKEYVNKELTAVYCEPAIIESMVGRQKNEDSQSSLADISDNKDSPPCSVNSNPQMYQLPSRLSIMSSISSSSSASSAAALTAKLALKALGSTKYAKKLSSQEALHALTDKLISDETYNRVTREWKNHHLVTATILNCANTELNTTNVSNVELMDHRNRHLRDNFVRSSTPSEDAAADEKIELTATPKSTKKGKAVKRSRSKITRANVVQTNGNEDVANTNTEPGLHVSFTETDTPSGRKKSRLESTESKLGIDVLANSPSNSLQNDPADELIGKSVFAKWSDNNYYPGIVGDRIKTKYKVNFYDGKSKTLIPEFVIPIPKILREGLSVYATTKANDYGSVGIIVDSHTSSMMSKDNSDTYYTVEIDEGERLRVQVRDIFLSADQAQVLKEEIDYADKSSLPSTPKALGQVTLDNVVDGKRRSKRIGTPVFSTPKSKSSGASSSTSSKIKSSEPSVSGVSVRLKDTLENESVSSDSNVESTQMDMYVLRGVQREIISTPYEQTAKGSQNRIKGKPRSRKKIDDPQTIAKLGPIPPANSNIFKGMSFILTCVLVKELDRYKDTSSVETATDTETENEDDWMEQPFVRERLHTQILAGGGKIYEDFDQIPKDEYKNTKLITNVPNRTAKNILCLSVGIPAYNHKWIIRCCLEGKIVNAAEDALPTGWSLQKKAYVETFQVGKSKPLSEKIVIIPNLASDEEFAIFWRQVCENAGAVVLIADNSGAMEAMDFGSNNVIVLSNLTCPSWAMSRANHLRIPVLSTTWVVQCLIEGKLCSYDQHPRFKYNYIQN